MRFAEIQVKERGGDSMWANARISALDFYLKLGYKTIGEEFYIPDVGSHIVIYKEF